MLISCDFHVNFYFFFARISWSEILFYFFWKMPQCIVNVFKKNNRKKNRVKCNNFVKWYINSKFINKNSEKK